MSSATHDTAGCITRPPPLANGFYQGPAACTTGGMPGVLEGFQCTAACNDGFFANSSSGEVPGNVSATCGERDTWWVEVDGTCLEGTGTLVANEINSYSEATLKPCKWLAGSHMNTSTLLSRPTHACWTVPSHCAVHSAQPVHYRALHWSSA